MVLGDLHLGVKNSSEVMFRHQSKFFNFMIDYMKQNNIDTILQCGDLWDSRRNTNMKTLQFAYDCFFDLLKDNNIHMHTVIGNHDIYLRNSLDIHSSGLLLRNYDCIDVYDQCTTIELDGCTVDMIPWICDQNREQCFDYIKNSKSDVCLGHFEINQFPAVGQSLFEGGMSREQFSHFKQVFSGHFHCRSKNDNITYVGTPYQLTWNDATTENGFIVFDTETLQYYYVENPNRYYHYLTYDDKNKFQTSLEGLALEDSFVKIVIKSKSRAFNYNTYINKVFAGKPADVKFVEQSLIDVTSSNQNATLEVKDTLDLITSYIDGIDYDHKERLKNFMVQLYNEAITINEENQ